MSLLVDSRALTPIDDQCSHVPFQYGGNVLGTLREDQVPRYYAALTDRDTLPKQKVKLADLVATQNRVEHGKVEAIMGTMAKAGSLPVVVRFGGKDHIADGHHRLAAHWMNGDDEADVHFKDIEEVSNLTKMFFKATVTKVDESLGLVFGWGIICKQDGIDYWDVQNNHIPEDAMVYATTDFMKNSQMAGEMHQRMDAGTVVHSFPLTSDIAAAMGIVTKTTGWMVAMAPDKVMLSKFKSGEYTGFSIGGEYLETEEAA